MDNEEEEWVGPNDLERVIVHVSTDSARTLRKSDNIFINRICNGHHGYTRVREAWRVAIPVQVQCACARTHEREGRAKTHEKKKSTYGMGDL